MMQDDGGADPTTVLLGLDEAQSKLVKSLKNFTTENEEKAFPLTLHLRMGGHGSTEPVQSFQFELSESITSLANDVLETAKQEAEGIGTGRIPFFLTPHQANGRCTFSLAFPRGEDPEEDEMAMNPSHKGMVSQQMRHNEKLINITVNSWHTINKANERALADKDDRIRVLERERLKMMEVYEKLIQQQHQRDLDVKQMEAAEARKKQVGDLLMMGAPTIINAIAQKRLMPEEQTPLEAVAEGWLSTIDAPTFHKLLGSGLLEPGQVAGLHQLMAAFVARDESRKQLSAPAPSSEGPPATMAEIVSSFASPSAPHGAPPANPGTHPGAPGHKKGQ